MTNIDLEKYRTAWKKERSFEEKKLSQTEIYGFIKSVSKNILGFFKKGLVFDIVYKLILLVALTVLFFLVVKPSWLYINLFLVFIIMTGIVWQINILNKIPNKNPAGQNFLDVLRDYIGFYYEYYVSSIFIGALSNALFFLIGSLYYLYFKYQEIPHFHVDDFIVMGIGLVLSYGLGAIVQLKQNKFHIKQLEKCLKEIEENTFTQHSVETYRNKRFRNLIFLSIGLITGFLLLIFLIYKLTN